MPLSNPNTPVPLNLDLMANYWNRKAHSFVQEKINESKIISDIMTAASANVYHYCPLNILEYILMPHNYRNGSQAPYGTFRASSATETNDETEYQLGEELISDAVKTSKNKLLQTVRDELLLTLGDQKLRQTRTENTFLSCFSFDSDSVSQWDRYADKANGVAIGFEISKVQLGFDDSSLSPYGLSYPVIYDEAKKSAMANLVTEAFAKWFERPEAKSPIYNFNKDDKDHQEVFKCLFLGLVGAFAPILKNKDFEVEHEFRDVVNNHCGQHDVWVETNDGKRFVYLQAVHRSTIMPPSGKDGTIEQGEEQVLLPITEIILGPRLNFIKNKQNVKNLLSQYGYNDVEVKQSKSPLK